MQKEHFVGVNEYGVGFWSRF